MVAHANSFGAIVSIMIVFCMIKATGFFPHIGASPFKSWPKCNDTTQIYIVYIMYNSVRFRPVFAMGTQTYNNNNNVNLMLR